VVISSSFFFVCQKDLQESSSSFSENYLKVIENIMTCYNILQKKISKAKIILFYKQKMYYVYTYQSLYCLIR
jgi:hypothetical protein